MDKNWAQGRAGGRGKMVDTGVRGVHHVGMDMTTVVGAKPPVRMNHRHEGLLNFLVMNPQATQREAAKVMKLTECWVSTVVNSSLFQQEYKARCVLMGELAVHSHVDKLGRVGAKVMEAIEKRLDGELDEGLASVPVSENFLVSTMNGVLDRLGLLPNRKDGGDVTNNTQNVFLVDAEGLKEARERAAELHTKDVTPMLVNSGGEDNEVSRVGEFAGEAEGAHERE